MKKEILMGTLGSQFNDGVYQDITFCVTEECNLRCKYCYMTGKNSFKCMSLEVAKDAVDFFLAQPVTMDAVVWDFIGGEPTLEIDLIDKISDYIKLRMYELNHPWFNNYMFCISTNGILYDSDAVQRYITKNHAHLSIGITIDGTKEKHDLQRVDLNGNGSYDRVVKNIPLWKKQFPNANTKVTFSSADLPYLKDSIIHLWNMGLNIIPANVVFEDVWADGDEEIFEQQLKELADYVLEHEMWWDYSVRFFDYQVGFPLGEPDKKHNFCGAGRMRAVDCDGNIYPCIRFLDFCLNGSQNGMIIGNIYDGIDENRVCIFNYLTIGAVNDNECENCPVASGCFTCTGNNFGTNHTIFKRTKFHCKLQKAQVKVNEYFWRQVAKNTAAITPHEVYRLRQYALAQWNLDGAKYLYFILNDGITPHCSYSSATKTNVMSQKIFDAAIQFAENNHMVPVFLGNPYEYLASPELYQMFVRIDAINHYEGKKADLEVFIPIYDSQSYTLCQGSGSIETRVCILRIEAESITMLSQMVHNLSLVYDRINLVKVDYKKWSASDIKEYRFQLSRIKNDELAEKKLSILADQSENKSEKCQAGISEFAVAPDGNIYVCPGYYFSNFSPLGNIFSKDWDTGVSNLISNKMLACTECTAVQCKQCSYINMQFTGTPNIPRKKKCAVMEAELIDNL